MTTIQTEPSIAGLLSASINDVLLADACQLYADEHLSSDERDDFIHDFMNDDDQLAILKKCVCDVIVIATIIESSPSFEVFEAQIHAYAAEANLDETDEVALQMKSLMLSKMSDDILACEQCLAPHEVIRAMTALALDFFHGRV